MTNTNITAARANLYKLAESCLDFNEVVNINTKKGNVIMLSEEEYNGILETLYLCNIPGLAESVNAERGKKTKDFEEFAWDDKI